MRPHLSHLFMLVADLERTRAFYVGTLRLELRADEGGYIRIGGEPGFDIGIEQGPPESLGAPGFELTIRVGDVDAEYERLRAAGVAFESDPQDMPWGARHAWFRDPDGYRCSIYSRS